ncbi:hypothetical protein Mgra_00003047 [Meloidogyne graminicola]|uniref:RING-type domain-containing protein n=1 Tax=Meloidogyne graminicola TaxID=189291 RepID=A0A8S9ZX61_9BILA|nr:hypothetical protein Mgra_00003047 [Meloidogyne graminicola]
MSINSDPSCSGPSTRVQFFRRQKPKSGSIRQRQIEKEENLNKVNEDNPSDSNIESDNSSAESTEAEKIRLELAEKRKLRNTRITSIKKRREDSTSELSSDEEDNEHSLVKFDPDVKFSSSGATRSGPNDMGATARTEVDTDYTKDAQSQFERVQQILKKKRLEMEEKLAIEEEERKKYGERAKKANKLKGAETLKKCCQMKGHEKPKIYQGLAVYGAKEREDTVKGNASSGLNRIGPIRATQYMRASVRWDYAPDICKDYKETGYCTFGGFWRLNICQKWARPNTLIYVKFREDPFHYSIDSCKFMHDRTDYKHGWEIERDWEQGNLKESKEDEFLVSSEESGTEEDKLPHSCYICREHFKQPVVTKCKHYFCEGCALRHYQKSKKCAICGEKTDGKSLSTWNKYISCRSFDILARIKARNEVKQKDEDNHESSPEPIEVKTLEMAEEENTNQDPNN